MRRTSKDHVHGEEVGADGKCDHGEGEGEELVDDVSVSRSLSVSNAFLLSIEECIA